MRIQQQTRADYIAPHTNKGALDGVITNTLRTLDTNPMVNAVGIDLFSMVAPRTYIDTKERNKYAGAETFFREFTGTLIVCLSASYLAKGIAYLANKLINPKTPINPNSWFSKDSINFLKESWNSSDSTRGYISNVFENVSGLDGKNIKKFSDVDWDNIEWVDEKRWSKIKWDNKKYKGIHERIKSKESFFNVVEDLITDKDISKKDKKNVLSIVETRFTNILGASNVSAEKSGKQLSTSVSNLLRDVVDMGKDVFTNKNINKDKALEKLLKINKIKSIGALTIASVLGLTNQYINRKITEKRTGVKGFVGDTNYQQKLANKETNNKKEKGLLFQKLLASTGMAIMAAAVMKVKSPKDFVKKLEFTGPVTSGNAIKTVYASTLIGRFMASDNKDELRETATRDYLGFLNWLVLGGFASKGVANLLDRKRENLFNETKSGKGIKHWLNNVSLKSHNEIASKGAKFASKNMWKLNLANAAGLAYSTIALGVLLPKLNILITKHKQKSNNNQNQFSAISHTTFDEFKKSVLSNKVNV